MGDSIYTIQRLRAMSQKLDRENNFTPCHSENVANLSLDLCRELGIRGKRKDMIVTASLIHDVGKFGVDKSIWAKPGKLSASDWLEVKRHPALSAQLAKQAGLGKDVIETIYYHHVWFNGHGYPDVKKKGSRIPIGARIIAVCDAYDAMVSQRPYKEGLQKAEAIEELKSGAVRQFDPRIVQVFAEMLGGSN